MYNDSNELLAVAKLSRPITKDFTKEALIRVKLDFKMIERLQTIQFAGPNSITT